MMRRASFSPPAQRRSGVRRRGTEREGRGGAFDSGSFAPRRGKNVCSCKPPAVLEPGAPKTGKQPFVAARGKKSPRFRVRAVERLCGNSSGQLPQAGVLWGSQDLLVGTRCTDADGRETMRGRRSVEAASTLWVAVASQGEPKLPRALPLRPTRCCDNNGGAQWSARLEAR